MCEGFGGFYHKSGKVYFCEPYYGGDCSHHETARRLPEGIDENDLIPFQIQNWKKSRFEWDVASVPDWVDNKAKKVCLEKLAKVKPIWNEYKKVCAPALEEYDKVCEAAWNKYDKVRAPAREEYEKVCDVAQAEYNKVRTLTWKMYEKVCYSARAEYDKVRVLEWKVYKKVCNVARARYEKVCTPAWDEMIRVLKGIEGYCKEPLEI